MRDEVLDVKEPVIHVFPLWTSMGIDNRRMGTVWLDVCRNIEEGGYWRLVERWVGYELGADEIFRL